MSRLLKALSLQHSTQLEPERIVHRRDQILFRPEIPLRGLNGGVTEQQLDLFKVSAGFVAEFRYAESRIMPNRKSHPPNCWVPRDHLWRVDSA